MVEITKSMVEDMLFCSVMEVLTDSKDWPNVVMCAYKRSQPNVEHYAEWCGEYLRVVHCCGDLTVEWKLLRDVCCSEHIRYMVGDALNRLVEMDEIQTRV